MLNSAHMNTRLIILACAAGFLSPISAAEDSPLAKQMESVDDSYKAMRKETDAAKGAAEARKAQQALIKTMGETPNLVAKMPAGPAKELAAAEYRKMIGQAYVALCEMEEAFLKGKPEEVAKITAALKELKKAGHDKFMEEEE